MHNHEWKPTKPETETRAGHKHILTAIPSSPDVDWYTTANLDNENKVHVHKVPTIIDFRAGPITTRGDEPEIIVS